jgi:hypothetical protein
MLAGANPSRSPASMGNRGKLWSIDDDQKLLESPQGSNALFGNLMGRSENAIKFRRSHLAAKMHQSDPDTPLEECVSLMAGDMQLASSLLQEWNEKRASLSSFLDANRKRKAQELAPPPPVSLSPFFRPEQGGWHDHSPDERISAICQSIREEGGSLASVFNDPQFLPTLIRHYPGFEAFARVVQARASA